MERNCASLCTAIYSGARFNTQIHIIIFMVIYYVCGIVCNNLLKWNLILPHCAQPFIEV